ncbi:MAG: ATP-binding protein [Anaerolineae bacterium]|nr:ATP-binding protein [Anaerolineae bacterium]
MPETSPHEDNTNRFVVNVETQTTLNAQRLELLRRAALSFSASLDLEDVLHSVLEEAQAILAAGSWSVWLLDEAGAFLTCWQAQGPAGDALRGYQITLGRGVESWVVRSNTSVYVEDLSNDPRHDERIATRNQIQAGSLISCPLNVGSRGTGTTTTIGALTVVSTTINAFNDEDTELVEILAASASTAIHNARLHEQSQQELERRQLVEGALRESESHYRTLVETSPDSIFLLALDGRILQCNHRMLALHGYERSTDVLGKSFLSLIVPEDRAEALDVFNQILLGHTLHDRELTLVRSDGTPFAGELGAALTADSRGEPAGIVAFARDISDRKQAEAAVRRHNLELRVLNDIATRISQSHDLKHLLESALDKTLDTLDIDAGWVVLFDPDGGGLPTAETEIRRGLLSKAEIAERSGSLLNQLVERARSTRQPAIMRSVELFEPYAGASAPCQVVAIPLLAQDRVVGAMAVAGLRHRHPRNISFRQVQLLAAIGHQIGVAIDTARLTQEAAEGDVLRRLDQMRADLIANFSHDLRSPLGLIKMTCSTLLRDDIDLDPETQKDFLSDIIAQTDRLSRLVEGILDLGKLEAGQLILDRIPMDLGTLMHQLFDEAQQQIPTHKCTLDLPKDPLIAIADPVRIDQVLHNLLDNAVKYSPRGGPIDIRGYRKRNKVLFSISDSGIGIPEDQLDLIFERFYRVQGEATEHISGTGLGLTTCRGIVEAHGGKIWATSTLGVGSTFTFSLPAAPDVPGS